MLQKLCLIAALAILYLTNLGGAGWIGPDEPRYASIGRAMAQSGDWVTPTLDGQPWFEKPPLLYWTTAAGNRFGIGSWLGDEWAARLPVALIGLAFLMFFYGTLEREFSARVALAATAILGTSAGWATLSFVAVTDLPMAAAFNTAMLIALFGPQALDFSSARGREGSYTRQGWVAGFFLGLAVLGKAFVPLVLIVPVFLVARGKRWRIVAGCLLTALPWHILMHWRHGAAFWDVYFWQQQFSRLFSPAIDHVQPFWFYVPVLLAGLFPWTPLVALIGSRRSLDDERVRFLLVFVVYGLVFFSASLNKLPGYVLPLVPALAIILAVSLDRARAQAGWLVACCLLLGLVPLMAAILPQALDLGITHVDWGKGWSSAPKWPLLIPVVAAVAAWGLAHNDPDQEWSDRRRWAPLVVALAAVACIAELKSVAFPVIDRQISARAFWREHADASACVVAGLKRDWVYGLNYYAGKPLPVCDETHRPRIVSRSGSLAIE